MIVDKRTGTLVSDNATNSQHEIKIDPDEIIEVEERSEMPDNGIIDVYNAIKEIVRGVRWRYYEPKSEKIFHTVQFNGGQYEFIVTGDSNPMAEIGFPAAFIHFINIRWTQNQQSINEGSAELRIQIVMNILNNYDDDKDTEIFYVAQRVIQTIQEERPKYPALAKECKLTYMDTATSYHSGLQSLWLTFSVKFTEINVWVKRKTVRRFIVAPPFTNHSDQKNPETQNIFHHTNADHPRTYEDAAHFDLKNEETENS